MLHQRQRPLPVGLHTSKRSSPTQLGKKEVLLPHVDHLDNVVATSGRSSKMVMSRVIGKESLWMAKINCAQSIFSEIAKLDGRRHFWWWTAASFYTQWVMVFFFVMESMINSLCRPSDPFFSISRNLISPAICYLTTKSMYSATSTKFLKFRILHKNSFLESSHLRFPWPFLHMKTFLRSGRDYGRRYRNYSTTST